MIIIIIIINVFIHHKIKTTYLMLHNYNPNKISYDGFARADRITVANSD